MYFKILNKIIFKLLDGDLKGYDPYDLMLSPLFRNIVNYKFLWVLTQMHRFSPLNLRKLIGIKKFYNTKSIALVGIGLSYLPKFKSIFKKIINIINLDDFKLENNLYSVDFNIFLSHHFPQKGKPDLIISLFCNYAIVRYCQVFRDKNKLELVLKFKDFINLNLPKFENNTTLWYSYNFYKINEIYNSTAKIGEFYSMLYQFTNDSLLLMQIEKILNYLLKKQREDGSWPYGELIPYTDGYHTAFILEAIWYMKRVVPGSKYEKMFSKGLLNYIKYLIKPNGQPLHYHPIYKPKDIRSYLIETDIRDCAMAIILLSKIGDFDSAKKIFNWTCENMYDSCNDYFYYYKNKLFKNKIEFIRSQAWMMYALSVLYRNCKKYENNSKL